MIEASYCAASLQVQRRTRRRRRHTDVELLSVASVPPPSVGPIPITVTNYPATASSGDSGPIQLRVLIPGAVYPTLVVQFTAGSGAVLQGTASSNLLYVNTSGLSLVNFTVDFFTPAPSDAQHPTAAYWLIALSLQGPLASYFVAPPTITVYQTSLSTLAASSSYTLDTSAASHDAGWQSNIDGVHIDT